jgi:chromosome segregation ATPase
MTNSIETDLVKVLEKIDSKIDKLDEKFEKKFEKLDNKIDKISSDVNELKTSVVKLEEKVDSLDKRVEKLDKRVEKIESEQLTFVKDISDLKGTKSLIVPIIVAVTTSLITLLVRAIPTRF